MTLPPGGDLIVFGAGGGLGRAVLAEALSRELRVTAAVRDPGRHPDLERLGGRVAAADVTTARGVANASVGHRAAIATLYDATGPQDVFFAAAAGALLNGLGAVRIPRLVMAGAAAALETAPGTSSGPGATNSARTP